MPCGFDFDQLIGLERKRSTTEDAEDAEDTEKCFADVGFKTVGRSFQGRL